MKELFVFWQFNGDNRSYCQLKCPECYGRDVRNFKHYWNGNVAKWEKAFERLDQQHGSGGIFFVFSYGEATLSHGFFECVEMIGKHPAWTLNIITNLLPPTDVIAQLVESRLVKEKRLFVNPCWHPEGVDDTAREWETFKRHLLMLKAADVPTQVMMVWFKPVIKDFPKYFEWLDKNDFRVGVRRFVHDSLWSKIPKVRGISWFRNRYVLEVYTEAERGYIYAYTTPKVIKYGLDLASPRGKICYAGKDMILVEHTGKVRLCASCTFNEAPVLGNVFDANFKLNVKPICCPTNNCGGDFGMLVLPDEKFGPLPTELQRDTFLSQVEGLKQDSPVPYPKRAEMLHWLEKLKCGK